MIRKIVLTVSLVFFAISMVTGTALAYNPSGNSPEMTNNNTALPAEDKTVFEWSTTPFSYIQFKLSDVEGAPLTIKWTWKFGTSYAATETLTLDDPAGTAGDPTHVNIWGSLANWNDVKIGKAGDWTVSTHYDSEWGGGIKSDSFKLNAAPEPISSALFLIGGLGMAARYARRKKGRV